MIDQKTTGLYHKFDITRTDGRDRPGGDREGADYFVLDLTHDPFAIPALRAYIEACREQYPALAKSLTERYLDTPAQEGK